MKARLYYEGDRVTVQYIDRRKHGKVTNVFEGEYSSSDRYRIELDDGSSCADAYAFELEPENPLETLARCNAMGDVS